MLHLQDIESEVNSAAMLVDAKLIYSSHELPSRDRIPIWNEVVWRNYVPLDKRNCGRVILFFGIHVNPTQLTFQAIGKWLFFNFQEAH